MTGIIYCGAEERLIRFNLRRRNTIRGSRHILSMCSAVPPSDFPNFRGIVRFSFLLFPLLLFFFSSKQTQFFSRRQRGRSSTNEGTPWRIRLGEAEEVIERRGKWAKRVEKRANSKVQRLFYVIFPLWPP